jgi:AraC-like DNA-binding protein
VTTAVATVDVVPLARTVLDRLQTHGVDVVEALHQASIDPARFGVPRARLTTRELFALWAAVEAQLESRRDLGLEIGVRALDHPEVGAPRAALLAPNLGEALVKLGRYKKLVCPEHVELKIARGEAQVRFHWILADVEVPRLLADATFASFVELARRGTGLPLETHFGCEVVFAAPFDRVVFDEKELALPFRTHDGAALARLVPALDAALGERQAVGGPFVDEVRVAIARQMYGGRPSVGKVARELHLSARTLQRRLEEMETSFQAQLDDVRQKTARRLLANTDLDAVEVAFFLGFEEPNSFARAFRGWEGTTPARWRGETAPVRL